MAVDDEKVVGVISNGLEKYNLDMDIILYRRTDKDYTEGILEGETFIIKQFLSTSVKEDATLKGDILTVYRVKKGSIGAYVKNLSNYKEQEEFLIDKGALCKLKSRQGKAIEIEVR